MKRIATLPAGIAALVLGLVVLLPPAVLGAGARTDSNPAEVCKIRASAQDAVFVPGETPNARYGLITNRCRPDGGFAGIRSRVTSNLPSGEATNARRGRRTPHRNFVTYRNPPPGEYEARMRITMRLQPGTRWARVSDECETPKPRRLRCEFTRTFSVGFATE